MLVARTGKVELSVSDQLGFSDGSNIMRGEGLKQSPQGIHGLGTGMGVEVRLLAEAVLGSLGYQQTINKFQILL